MSRGGSGGLGTISVELEARIAKFESDIGRAARLLEREMSRSARTSERAITEMRKTVEKEMQAVRRVMEQTRTLIVSVFSFNLASRFAGEIRAMNDGFIGIQAQLRQVTKGQEALTQATRETFEVSQRTFAAFESGGMLVGRTTRALVSAGQEQSTALEKSLKFTEAVNNAFILSGAKAIEMKNALIQLSQGLAAGALRGDEYRSVAEQGSKVIETLAKNLAEVDGKLQLANGSMGVTSGRLRELAYEGKLTTDLVVNAMLNSFEELGVGVAVIPLSIERAFTRLRNAAEEYIGSSQGISQFLEGFAQAVNSLANNFRILAEAIIFTGKVLMVALAGRAIGAMATFAAQLRSTALAREADAKAAFQQAQAAQLAARQQMTVNAATREAARASVAAVEAKVAQANATRALIRSQTEQALSTARMARAIGSSDGYLAAMGRKLDLDQRDRVLTGYVARQYAVLGDRRAELIRQNALYTTSQRDVSAATSATSAALATMQRTATTAVATLARLGAGFLSLIGGWPTLILGAVYGLYELYRWTERMEKARNKEAYALREYTEQLRERLRLEEEMRQRGARTLEESSELGMFEDGAKKVEELKNRIEELQRVAATAWVSDGSLESEIAYLTRDLERLQTELADAYKTAADAGIVIAGSMEPVFVTAMNAADAFAVLTGQVRQLNGAVNDGALFSDSGKKYLDNLNQQIETFGMLRSQLILYQAEKEAEKEQDKEAAAQIMERAKVLAELTRQQEQNRASRGRSTNTERDANRVLQEQLRMMKEREKALKAERDALRALEQIVRRYSGTMSGPMLQALEANERLQSELNKELEVLLEMGPPIADTYNQIAEAMAAVARQSEINLENARNEEQVGEIILAQLDRELEMLSKSTIERGVAAEMERALADARQKNIQLSPAYLSALEEEVRLRLRNIEAAGEQQRVYEDLRGEFINATESMATAFADFLVDGANDFDSFADSIIDATKRMVSKMIAEFIKMQFINPMLNSAFGMNLPVSMGGGGFQSFFGGGGMNSGTGFGTAAPWLAAAGAAYYGAQNRQGFGERALSAASYGALGLAAYGVGAGALGGAIGVGTSMAAIGAGTGGVVTGAAAGASTGAMAGGAGAFSSLGAAAWVPVVGWILAIAALVDLASGGKLFGTAFRPEKLESTIGIRDGQAMADNQLTEVRQRSLFRGRTWRSRSLEVPDEMQQAAQSLYDTLYDIGIGTAARLQADAPPLMDVAIRTITEYDKKGREKATKIFVDILGRSFEEASEELAGKRVVAETIINVLDSVFAGVSSTAERWRGDAEKLLEGAEFLVLALSDVRRGFTLLSSDSSIDDLVDLIEMLSMGSESLSDTYARVAASVRILEDALWLMNSSLDVAREDFVIFANDIAVAAGGLDRAQQLWSSYFNTFFTAQERAELALLRSEERAGTALGAIGLDPSIFMDEGGAQLFRSMFTAVFDQLTPQQVVLWLEAGEALAAVFGAQQQYNEALGQVVPNLEALAEATRSYAEFVYSLQEQLDSMDRTDFVNSLTEIAREMENNRQRMHELARAAGLAEARSEDLAVAVSLAARKFQEAIAKLNEETRKLAVDLYGTPLSRLEEEIRRLEQASRDAGTGVSNAGDSFERFVDSTRQAVEDLLLDKNLSPLNDREMLEVALGRLSRTGSEQDARTTLEIGRRLFASGRDYEQLFRRVTAMIRPEETNGSPGTSGGPISSPELERLYAERDRLREEEEAIRRRALAMQFAQNVADLSGAEELDFQTILDRFDVSVAQLAADLGLDEDELFGFLETLMNATYDLEDFVEVYNAGVDRIVAAVEGSRVMEENAPLIESVPLLPIAMDEGTPVFGEIDEEDFVDLSETTAAITEVNETLRDLLSRIADSSAETVVALQASAEAAAVRAVELVANTNRSGFTNDYRSIVK